VKAAFDYAVENKRKKVTAVAKANIMKFTDGLFYEVAREVAKEYEGQVEYDEWLVDAMCMQLVQKPENYDVLVMANLYGDILSDVAAQIAGSVGLAGSANIGTGAAMFEAIHGSAPRRAGQNLANPSGLLLGAVMMLVHIDQADVAERVHNAWLATLEDGVHTYDIFQEGLSKEKVGTKEFAQAVVSRVGQKPEKFKPVSYKSGGKGKDAAALAIRPRARKDLLGVDVFLHWTSGSPDDLAAILKQIDAQGLRLHMISNRGVKVWPGGHPETFCSDHWRCRYMAADEGGNATHRQIASLLSKVAEAGLDFIKTDNLCAFDGTRAYSLEQGE